MANLHIGTEIVYIQVMYVLKIFNIFIYLKMHTFVLDLIPFHTPSTHQVVVGTPPYNTCALVFPLNMEILAF